MGVLLRKTPGEGGWQSRGSDGDSRWVQGMWLGPQSPLHLLSPALARSRACAILLWLELRLFPPARAPPGTRRRMSSPPSHPETLGASPSWTRHWDAGDRWGAGDAAKSTSVPGVDARLGSPPHPPPRRAQPRGQRLAPPKDTEGDTQDPSHPGHPGHPSDAAAAAAENIAARCKLIVKSLIQTIGSG